jgi:hypothetical protein
MKTNILNYNNQNGYGKKAYNHVKKKGGIYGTRDVYLVIYGFISLLA